MNRIVRGRHLHKHWMFAAVGALAGFSLVPPPGASDRAAQPRDFDVVWSSEGGPGAKLPTPATSGAYVAFNPAHHFFIRFGESGPSLIEGGRYQDPDHAWQLNVGVTEFGTDGAMARLEAARLVPYRQLIEAVRPGPMRESYLNNRRGLAQELRLDIPPEGLPTNGDAQFRVSLSGDLAWRVLVNDEVVQFFDRDGGIALRWAGLRAVDGAGGQIKARFEQDPLSDPGEKAGEPVTSVQLVVEATDAVYPVSISSLFSSPRAEPQATNHLVISEIQVEGDGFDPERDEFIEVHNPTSTAVSLAGWSLQHRTRGGGGAVTQDSFFSGSVPAHGYFLAARDAYNGSSPRDFRLFSMQHLPNNGGTVMLVNSQMSQTACPPGSSVVDRVAYGDGGDLCPETAPAPAPPGPDRSIERKPILSLCGNVIDSDNNNTDFGPRPGPSEPQSSSSAPEACADLSVSMTDASDPVGVGATLTYTVTVSNVLGTEAVNTLVTADLPVGVTFISTTGCDNDPDGVPSCRLGTIPEMGSKTYTISVTVDGCPGSLLTNSVTASSDTTDPTSANDTDMEDTSVTTCDDGDACTTNDMCEGAFCIGTLQDTDTDGTCDALDCAPLDPNNSPPPEVGSTLVWDPLSTTTFSWSAVVGATSYPVYGGIVTQPWGYNHTCIDVLASTSASDASTPSVGGVFYYLVATRNACSDSGVGSGTGGPRPTLTPCP